MKRKAKTVGEKNIPKPRSDWHNSQLNSHGWTGTQSSDLMSIERQRDNWIGFQVRC
jgi:hypothetical protein